MLQARLSPIFKIAAFEKTGNLCYNYLLIFGLLKCGMAGGKYENKQYIAG
jgi:predicted SAM-dependent methyltransferase